MSKLPTAELLINRGELFGILACSLIYCWRLLLSVEFQWRHKTSESMMTVCLNKTGALGRRCGRRSGGRRSWRQPLR